MKKPYESIPMTEVINSISLIGHKVTVLVEGETGTGKSSILKELSKLHPNHVAAYVDISTKDTGDLLIPRITTIDGTAVSEFVPNSEWGLQHGKPLIVMLDELGKASKSVMNSCLRVMLERKIGTHALPEGSIVFATTNLTAEGLGDNMPAHARNRIVTVRMAKPSPMDWRMNFAEHNGVHPVAIATVLEFPEMFASFQDYEKPEQNSYIYDPRSPRKAFVTPRSLERASDILHACSALNEDVLVHLLQGAVGERAAQDILMILKLDNTLPSFASIIASPETAKISKSGASLCLIVSKLIGNCTKENMDTVLIYLDRLPREAIALFMRGIMSSNSPKRPIAVQNRKFTELCVRLGFLFS